MSSSEPYTILRILSTSKLTDAKPDIAPLPNLFLTLKLTPRDHLTHSRISSLILSSGVVFRALKDNVVIFHFLI